MDRQTSIFEGKWRERRKRSKERNKKRK